MNTIVACYGCRSGFAWGDFPAALKTASLELAIELAYSDDEIGLDILGLDTTDNLTDDGVNYVVIDEVQFRRVANAIAATEAQHGQGLTESEIMQVVAAHKNLKKSHLCA
jgi:hypothetical protein